MKQWPVCDECGAPATTVVRDVFRHEVLGEMYVRWSPVVGLHYGCDRHPVRFKEILTGLPPTKGDVA